MTSVQDRVSVTPPCPSVPVHTGFRNAVLVGTRHRGVTCQALRLYKIKLLYEQLWFMKDHADVVHGR